MKARFRFFFNAILYRNGQDIENAFKTACVLHNMILDFDKGASTQEREWENVRWEDLEPTEEDSEDEDEDEVVAVEDDGIVIHPLPDLSPLTQVVQGSSPSTPPTYAHVFTVEIPRRDVKDVLQSSFTVQWITNGLEWPKGMKNSDKTRLPLARAEMELNRALHPGPSNLRALDDEGFYTRTIGRGLFSFLGYRYDAEIVAFIGLQRSSQEFDDLSQTDPLRKSYALQIKEGLVLDCYDHVKKGLCRASLANDPYKCFDTSRNAPAVANARISVHVGKNGFVKVSIKAGRKVPSTEVASEKKRFFLPPNTEILAEYGDLFHAFDFHHYPTLL